MCLRPKCEAFWTTKDGNPPTKELEYNPRFLALQLHLPPPKIGDLYPHKPQETDNGTATDYAFSRGWHCRLCGRVSSRWEN
jgi:hypothetical protein